MTLLSSLRRLLTVASSRPAQRRPASRPRLEPLEDRCLPSAYIVTTTADAGPGSLRDGINQVNADAGHALYASPTMPSVDEIDFAITAASDTGGGFNSATGVATFTPHSGLPDITNSVTIDGWLQPGFAGTPLIELNGAGAGAGANGLTITAGDSTVRGLVINGFGQNGILLQSGGGDQISGNYIGTDASGTVSRGNGASGVRIESSGNTVGGAAAGTGNVISGNKGATSGNLNSAGGVSISTANNNLVAGNLVGTNAAGNGALANSGFGIILLGASTGNTIGGTAAAARNVVSGNVRSGISLALGPTGNSVLDNYVGTDITGTFAIGNKSNGVLVTQGSNANTIDGNVISGNGTAPAGGVNIINSSNNVVQGNFIGTDYTGATSTGTNGQPLGNGLGGAGVAIQANPGLTSTGNTIGGATAAARNVIAGNLEAGVWFNGDGVLSNLLQGNFIGSNSGNGVQLTPFTDNIGGGANNTITGNEISGNSLAGIMLTGSGNTGNLLAGNSIHDNGGLGIDLGNDGATANTPGGPHVGPNDLQNFPVLTAAGAGSSVLLSGTLNGQANTTFIVDVYASPTADPSGYGQGQYYLGYTTVTTDASGNASFAADLSAANLPSGVLPDGWAISATATDPGGNTSEFSKDVFASSANALQGALTSGGTVNIQVTTPSQAQAVLAAANSLDPSTTPTSTIVLDLGGQTVQDTIANLPPQVTLTIVNGTFIGGSPALMVESGQVIIRNSTFSNATDAPTILVTGGSLTLRNDVVQESTGYRDAAVSVTGGTVDLGTATDPGGNTFNINGAGAFIHNTTANAIPAVGDAFEINGQATAWPAPLTVTINNSVVLVGNSPPPLTGSVNGTAFTGAITYTTIYGDQVTITLSTTAASASPVGQYAIVATLSGSSAGNYVIDPASTGTMYVVSVGADLSSATGAKSVVFWDNKGNAKLITTADLSSLDALNLVNQGGAAFDPKAVQQLQAWLSISPNATTAYQLAVDLAVMDLNVLAGNVLATDLIFAGALLPYASADAISGLTSGGFIDVQSLMSAANAVLSKVIPGDPSGDPNQAYEAALAQVLQAADGNTDFVQQEVIWNLFGL